MCTCLCMLKASLKCYSSDAFYTLFFETKHLTGLELTKWEKLTGQWTPEIHLFPLPQHWKQKCIPPCLAFFLWMGFQNQTLILIPDFSHWTVSLVHSLPLKISEKLNFTCVCTQMCVCRNNSMSVENRGQPVGAGTLFLVCGSWVSNPGHRASDFAESSYRF